MTQLKITGQCLCGSVQYEVSGTAERFYHCHCQRCRKATGTGHASNLLVSPINSIRWLAGKALLAQFKVPDAERFFNTFCTRCGSPMPREVEPLNGVLIPAGTINEKLPIKPQARIFWDSRAEWSCSDEDIPTFSEYPPGI